MSEVSKNYAELMRGVLKVRDEIQAKGECDANREMYRKAVKKLIAFEHANVKELVAQNLL